MVESRCSIISRRTGAPGAPTGTTRSKRPGRKMAGSNLLTWFVEAMSRRPPPDRNLDRALSSSFVPICAAPPRSDREAANSSTSSMNSTTCSRWLALSKSRAIPWASDISEMGLRHSTRGQGPSSSVRRPCRGARAGRPSTWSGNVSQTSARPSAWNSPDGVVAWCVWIPQRTLRTAGAACPIPSAGSGTRRAPRNRMSCRNHARRPNRLGGPADQGRRLMARAMISTARSSETADWKVIMTFDQCLIAETSEGPRAVEVPKDMCR